MTLLEIEEYLSFKNTSFVTDKTNFENEYTRNKKRFSTFRK